MGMQECRKRFPSLIPPDLRQTCLRELLEGPVSRENSQRFWFNKSKVGCSQLLECSVTAGSHSCLSLVRELTEDKEQWYSEHSDHLRSALACQLHSHIHCIAGYHTALEGSLYSYHYQNTTGDSPPNPQHTSPKRCQWAK